MNILIVGGGFLGRRTAELLDAAGHSVAVLDEDPDRLGLLDAGFQGVTAVGTAMDLNCLRSAGIEGCDAVAVVTSDDNLNITVGQIAKDFFRIPKVVARISDPQREKIFESFGLETFCPTNTAGEHLASALAGQRSWQMTFGVTTIALAAIPVEKQYFGGTTDDLELPAGCGLFGVLRENGRFLLLEHGGRLPLERGDSLLCGREID